MLLKLSRYLLSLYFWDAASLASVNKMQLRKFRRLFEHARKNSKFYKEFYGDHHVLDLEIESMEDIRKVPIVSKAILRNYSTREIMTCDLDEQIHVLSTSGSTGEPFKIAFNKFEDYTSHIRLAKTLMKKGYSPLKKIVLLARYDDGHEFAIEKDIKKFGWLQDKLGLFRRELISIFDPLESIIGKLEHSKPSIMWSTPSMVEIIARELKKTSRRLHVPLVLFMSENMSPDFLELFRERIGGDFIDLYGCMEAPSIGFGINQIDAKKVYCNSTLVEVLNTRRMGEAQVGDIVITNLINHSMPLIRYDLADYTEVLVDDSFPNQLIGKIFGRNDDIVYFGGKYTLTYHQTYQLFRDFHDCERYKFIQKADGEIVLQLKVTENADKEKVKDLALRRWNAKYPDYPLRIEWRESFAIDGKTGKFKVIEKLAG